MADLSLVEMGKKYVFDARVSEWENAASKVSNEALVQTINLMRIMEDSYNFKKLNKEYKKIEDQSIRQEVLKLLINYSKSGADFVFERIHKETHGNVNRADEFVIRLMAKMDENAALKGKERD